MKLINSIITFFPISRIILALLVLYFHENIAIVIALIFLSVVTDILDGYLARKFEVSSDFGGALDGLCDKIGMAIVVIGFIFLKEISLWMILIFFLREWLELLGMLYVSLGKLKKPNFQSLFLGKVITGFQLLGFILLLFSYIDTFYYVSFLIAFLSVVVSIQYYRGVSK
jgi:phosphatidylglycerophosphate synthase